MLRRLTLAAALLALTTSLASAQFATIGPTPPTADNGDRLSTTAWVRLYLTGTYGAGVAAALGIGVGSPGSFVVNGGALGVPSSGDASNLALGANQVTRANEAQGVARSVMGVAGNATANVADIQGSTANTFLGVNAAGTGLAFSVPALSSLTSSLTADVALSATVTTYADGPSIAQGTTGTWYVSGNVLVTDTAVAAIPFCKLWDGTTVIDSNSQNAAGANARVSISLSGKITSPAGNIRISCANQQSGSTTSAMRFNNTGNSKDSTITAFRIQ